MGIYTSNNINQPTTRRNGSSPIASSSLSSLNSLKQSSPSPFIVFFFFLDISVLQNIPQRKALQLLRLRLRVLLHHSFHSITTSLLSLSTRMVRRHRYQQRVVCCSQDFAGGSETRSWRRGGLFERFVSEELSSSSLSLSSRYSTMFSSRLTAKPGLVS